MRQAPVDPLADPSPGALLALLRDTRGVAEHLGHAQLVSISIAVEALDPLAVLEAIFEPAQVHAYLEQPSTGLAVAGAEAVCLLCAQGEDRFRCCQAFVDETLAHTLLVGVQGLPFCGPLFFAAFSFSPATEPGEAFPALQVFVPHWQVGTAAGRTVATANLLVEPGVPLQDLEALAARVAKAHATFRSFDYAEPQFAPEVPVRLVRSEEVGGEGRYQRSVSSALTLLAEGRFRKIVLARAQDLEVSAPFHPLRALNGLRERYRDCHAFSFGNGRGQSFIGASPERLLRVCGRRLSTEALAGSTRRGTGASEDAALGAALLRDEKELREHAEVVASLRRRLLQLGIEPECEPRPRLRRLAKVQHLHTPLEAVLPEGLRLLTVLEHLHPTPAVGGSPREAALPLIRSLEGFPRGLYAGALGWLDARGEGEFLVGLRSALMDGCRTRLYAGAGLVEGSQPEREYRETELKIATMREALL